ncbi:MAG: hypothetical protein LQ350_001525 [Teloschistes chrysophthalmus]|nr:MAG: hypothetical protein LQ350_001525 [Niorma chrysophthalma]
MAADFYPAINNFFLTYYQALENAAGVVSNNIEQMIQVVDVLVQPSVKMQDILLSLAVGLAFLGAPSFAESMLSLKAVALKASAQALVISTQQAPNVGRALWPAGTDKSQEIQMADLHIQLSNITGQMSDMMDQGVRLLMNDIGSFVEYADNGRYSGPNVTNTGEGTGLTVPSGTDDVAYALKTYLLSYSMWQNRWYATFDPGPFTSKADVEKRKYCKFGDGSSYCQYYDGISRQATTTVFYWSQISLRVYTLKCDGPKNAKHPGEMIDTIIHYGWAPLEVLFDGGFNCTAEGRAGSSSVNFNFDGTLDLACVSQLPIYLNCGDMCPTALVNNSCTFGDVGTLVKGACSDWNGWY